MVLTEGGCRTVDCDSPVFISAILVPGVVADDRPLGPYHAACGDSSTLFGRPGPDCRDHCRQPATGSRALPAESFAGHLVCGFVVCQRFVWLRGHQGGSCGRMALAPLP